MDESTLEDYCGTIYDIIRTIKDPEKDGTLEDLNVLYEDGVKVDIEDNEVCSIRIMFKPTVKHCTLATLIGLCIRVKLERNIPANHKISIFVEKGAHDIEDDVNKQINDKERVSAAMENPNIKQVVERCIVEPL